MSRIFWLVIIKCMLCTLTAQSLEHAGQVDFMDKLDNNLSYLIKDYTLENYFSISQSGVAIYASLADKQKNKVECFLYPEEFEAYVGMMQLFPKERMTIIYQNKGKNRWPDMLVERYQPYSLPTLEANDEFPLEGLRVALDPGHVAGSMHEADLEGKYVKSKATQERSGVAFWEANLTLSTAHLVAEQLMELGAEILLTRESSGQSAMGMDYQSWRRKDFLKEVEKELASGNINTQAAYFWKHQATEKDIYRRFFNQLDLKARAEKINAFRPHLTLIIHYNVDKNNWEERDEEGYFQPGYDNYCMAFIPGSFMEGELNTPEKRMHFLYLMVSDNLDTSMKLSSAFIEASVEQTEVPVVDFPGGPDYLTNYCLPTPKEGVFARNLALNSLVTSPLCYGESLCQDFWREMIWLSDPAFEVGGVVAPERVKAVAKAYVEAVLKYVK